MADETCSERSLKEIREAAARKSSGIYLAVVGMIEPLVLGYFLTQINVERLFGRSASAGYWLQGIAVLIVIVLVWHEFAMSSLCVVWVLDVFDFLFPLLLAIGQYVLIATLAAGKLQYWYFALAGIALMCMLSLVFQALKIKGRGNDAEPEKCLCDCMPRLTVSIVPVCAGLSAAFGAVLLTVSATPSLEVLLLSITTAGLATFGGFRFCAWKTFLSPATSCKRAPKSGSY